MSLTVDDDGTPIIVTGTATADTEIREDITYIKYVYWYNPTSTGHLCNITDGVGRSIIKMRAECDGDTQMWPIGLTVKGIRCDDMDSGTLYIYIS